MATPKMSARILVVDDDPAILYLVTETLSDAGYDCLPVTNGQEALAVIDTWLPDGILLDLMMPKVDGAQVVTRLRATCRRSRQPMPKIMIMTAGFKAEEMARELRLQHWIGKPYTLNDLTTKTAAMLDDVPPDGVSG